MDRLMEGLTDAQREAVEHVTGPLLILAGPGSGKTRVVTHRVAHLLEQGIAAHEILALTFTNKAAEEMRDRLDRLAPGQPVWVGTYHRFCAKLLRKYAPLLGIEGNYSIYDAEESRQLLGRVIQRLKVDLAHFTPNSIASAISWAKNRLVTHESYKPRPGHPLGTLVDRVYPTYQRELLKSNAVDFDDLLLHVAVLLRDNPEIRKSLDEQFRFVLVDEYQDTNLAQYAIARSLSIDHPNLAVTGDPDQSIYGWRGANMDNILGFERDFPDVHVVRLEQNYRSTQRILYVADRLISHNRRRKEKALFTENNDGALVRLITYTDHKEEAQSIAARIADQIHAGRRRPRDFAIFYRINALSLPFELALRDYGVPYQMVHGLEFFRRQEIKDVLAYLQLLHNPCNDIAFLRVINTPARGIGKTTLARLSDHAAQNGLTLLDAARQCDAIESLAKRPRGLLRRFVELFDRVARVADAPIEEILGNVLTETEYTIRLKKSKDPQDQDRAANIEELLTAAREFDERGTGERPLDEFLEEISLTGDTDDWEADTDRVTLMTLHASKGLEFPVIYLVAVEQSILPHQRAREQPDQLEEERRLMFVGITRAREELQISMAAYRDFRGQRKMTVPSSFLMELPRGEMDVRDLAATAPAWAQPDAQRPSAMPISTPPSARVAPSAQVTTAAELASASAAELAGASAAELAGASTAVLPAVSPDDFRQGMLVRHPTDGLGRVVALSGSGTSRKATVRFVTGAGEKKFVLASSSLRPVKK